MSEIPILQSERLLLRPLSIEDAPRMADLLQAPEIAANGMGMPQPFQLSDAEKLIQRFLQGQEEDLYTWAITLSKDNDLIGMITLIVTPPHRRAKIGFWIGKDYWNQGYATEASQILIKHAFAQHNLNRLYAQAFVGNEASVRVLKKLGMKYEGVLRHHLWHELSNEAKDTLVYSILKDELEKT